MSSSDPHVYVALLRGINVGGRNQLPMKNLVSIFHDAGCAHARTYIQSGNVVFAAAPGLAAEMPDLVTAAIAEQFGFSIPVLVRNAAELERAVRANPFLHEGIEERTLHVVFLRDVPEAALVDALDTERSPPDEFSVLGREIYLRCPNGLGRTKLTNAYFDSKLRTTSTVRNWKTTLKLLEMASAPA